MLFDLDGTLVDTIPLIVASFQHAYRTELDEESDEAEIKRWIGRSLRDAFTASHPDDVAALERTYIEFNRTHLRELQRDFPGAKQLLVGLREAGVRVGIATSKRRALALESLEVAGLGDLYDHLTPLEDSTRHKPDPEPLLVALAAMGAEASEATYVGDAVPDVLAAHAAGMPVIAVTWGAGEAAALREAGPDAVVDSMAELGALLGLPGVPSGPTGP